MEGSVQDQLEQTTPVDWQHNKDLGDCMIEIYNKGLWTDVTFRCKDHDENEGIHAHKIVLAARSPVFQAMFFGPCANGKDEVQLDNAEAKVLDLFLRYIYSDTVTLAEENASSVLEMAHYYQVSNLVQFCADYLTSITTAENACEILNLALRYEVTTLRDACCTFTDENAEEILSSKEFLELSEDCLTYILKGDTFYADENGIFIKAEEWSKRKLEERNIEKTGPNVRKTLGGSFYYIRLPTLTYKTLMECTRKKCYFSLQEFEDIVDFINEIPDSLVESNSCVTRLPTEEILTVNDEFGETNPTNTLTTSFQISVSRDVKLKNVTLAPIQKYFKYVDKFYSTRNCRNVPVNEKDTMSFFSNNNGKVMKLEENYYGNTVFKTAYVLNEVTGTDLSEDLNIVISGRLEVTNRKIKLSDNTVCRDNLENLQEEIEVAEIGGNLTEDGLSFEESFSNHGDDEENDVCLIFEQNLQLMSTDETQRVVVLTVPLTLTKTGSPYTVTVNLGFSCESEMKMKTSSSSKNIVTSEYGDVKVENISGDFAGITSLGFENISNRESAK
ncbi:uncharacterized protein LOC128554193 [Mercenaria mercenaria]|uniref:uncharacterized protein LOC128554193 n=1 Tax=Mercenaria mercenaria TaxID=6596 RepID=UPI00234F5AFD|nr:uncharacterized protein LOC128554193 [Mercenaria mercenaria]XP_053391416.1 uncharacterized protein LOC128554193 [Mercenaria mercenaria]